VSLLKSGCTEASPLLALCTGRNTESKAFLHPNLKNSAERFSLRALLSRRKMESMPAPIDIEGSSSSPSGGLEYTPAFSLPHLLSATSSHGDKIDLDGEAVENVEQSLLLSDNGLPLAAESSDSAEVEVLTTIETMKKGNSRFLHHVASNAQTSQNIE
jgi:hypothetical protein